MGKCRWIANSQVSKNFTVQCAAYSFHAIDQLTVRDAVNFRCDSNSRDPKTAKIALAKFAVFIIKRERRHQSIFAELNVVFTISVKSSAALQKLLRAPSCCN
jgi:hypothetical protein